MNSKCRSLLGVFEVKTRKFLIYKQMCLLKELLLHGEWPPYTAERMAVTAIQAQQGY